MRSESATQAKVLGTEGNDTSAERSLTVTHRLATGGHASVAFHLGGAGGGGGAETNVVHQIDNTTWSMPASPNDGSTRSRRRNKRFGPTTSTPWSSSGKR